MKAKKTPKTIHYKRASFMQKGATLQQYLANALMQRKKASQRREPLNQEDNIYRLWNSNRSQFGMLFGSLLVYSEGRDQHLVTLDDDQDEYEIDQLAPPKKNGKRQEFLESVLYFGILDDHLVVMQSGSLRARELEAFINWLLRECTSLLKADNGVFLNDHPTIKAKKKLSKQPVKKVSIGAPLATQDIAEMEEEEITKMKAKKLRFAPVGMGFDIIRAALGEVHFDKLKLNDSLDEANLQVTLEITYLRKTTEKAHKLLNNIATSMRHMDPDDVIVHLDGGGKLKGDDLKLFTRINVNTYNGLVDESDLYTQMYHWLSSTIEQGVIEP